jgi:hypothetical protein
MPKCSAFTPKPTLRVSSASHWCVELYLSITVTRGLRSPLCMPTQHQIPRRSTLCSIQATISRTCLGLSSQMPSLPLLTTEWSQVCIRSSYFLHLLAYYIQRGIELIAVPLPHSLLLPQNEKLSPNLIQMIQMTLLAAILRISRMVPEGWTHGKMTMKWIWMTWTAGMMDEAEREED